MEKITYTFSGLSDAIKSELQKDKEQIKVLDSLVFIKNPTFAFNPSKYKKLLDAFLDNEKQFKRALKRSIMEIVEQRNPFDDTEQTTKFINSVTIRYVDSLKIKMGEWSSKYENMPVSTECVVISVGKEQTYTKYAACECYGCGRTVELTIDNFTHTMQEPPKCLKEGCERKGHQMQINQKTFKTGPYKLITIQEPMDEAKHGSPKVYACEIKNNDVQTTFISQKKRIIGAFTSIINDSGVNDILIKTTTMNPLIDEGKFLPTKDELKLFKSWVQEKLFIPLLLARSIAPEIYNETLAKVLMAVCVAGGERVGRLRGDINGFLVGDPSVGKSKILDFVTEMIENSMSVNGATSTGAGITIAYDDKLKAPRTGAIPNCHKGVLSIDEFGKIRKEDLKYTLQSMEDGKIYYDKAGYDLDVLAETTIIAGLNPKHDYYDPEFSIVDNINLPGPVISRFDLKVNMLTVKDMNIVEKKLKHIDELRKIGLDEFIKKHDLIPTPLLKKYFTHVRTLHPVMTDEASDLGRKFYLEVLALQQKRGSLPIDTRFYEGIIRIATAYAKLLLTETVTEKHMQLAIDLQTEALETFYMNVRKGETQFNLMQNATTKEGAFKHAVKEAMKKYKTELVTDEAIVSEMLDRYLNFFKNDDGAWTYFVKMEEQKIILKTKGKYHL